MIFSKNRHFDVTLALLLSFGFPSLNQLKLLIFFQTISQFIRKFCDQTFRHTLPNAYVKQKIYNLAFTRIFIFKKSCEPIIDRLFTIRVDKK